ncbi:hypothetical protein VTI74DRAFT_3729 [Chaetomium olivicolor]
MISKLENETERAQFSLPLGDGLPPVTLAIPKFLVHFAETERDSFFAEVAESPADEESALVPAEVVAQFINHVAQSAACTNRHELIQLLWILLEDNIVGCAADIHTLAVSQLPGKERRQRRLISSYYSARLAAKAMAPGRRQRAMLRAQASGELQIHGLFGGQGNNKHYFDEMRAVWEMYAPLIRELVAPLSTALNGLSQDERVADQYPHGLDVLHWLTDAGLQGAPDHDYLISAPVSFPLIGLLQLAQFKAICMSLDVGPEEFPRFFSGLAGHSQGVVVAAAVSTASSWAGFLDASIKAVTILFWIGARCQQVFNQDPLSEEMTRQLESDGYGKASPMLSVSNIQRQQLQKVIKTLNCHLPPDKHAHMALANSSSSFVVSGPERTLAALTQNLNAASGKGQAHSSARIPYSQRKPSPATRFLPITIPCHCSLLDDALPLIDGDLKQVCSIRAEELRLPINRLRSGTGSQFGASDGADGSSSDADLTPLLVRLVTSKPVEWADLDFTGATHIIDFGPGGTSGVGALTHRNLVGSGARVILAGNMKSIDDEKSVLGSVVELFSPSASDVRQGPDWARDHRVSLVRTAAGVMIRSRFSRLLGLPPIMVAGMTPTTTRPEFVAAVMEAGYHVEFAAGGYHDADSLRAALGKLRDLMPAGRGITVNVIYAAPKAIAWQIPFIRQLRSEGFPVAGLTVGGGVPTLDVATEYITTLGVEHISFKPGSTASIRQVVEIAKNNPSFPIILQWTGGRGGGHHSAEDMYAPLLETYAEIRSCDNLVLLAGSGIGCADDVIPFLTGSWSLDRGQLCPMPVDGVLLGSRVMTCAEAFTSAAAKRAIAAAPGVPDGQWEGTYTGPTGGIMSVVSEMGEPIHVVATRGAQLWAEMDKLVFSADRKKRAHVLAANEKYIISRLNADFQRPWFGRKSNGMVCHVAEMTYEEVARRLLELTFINGRGWIDKSYAGLLAAFLLRTEERCCCDDRGSALEVVTSESACDANPFPVLEGVLRASPLASSTRLMHEDVEYFIQLCRRPGQKPVPFVPALDDHFETWFKKDSLWQSENVEAVVDQDANRTLILHGPVAARHTCQVDEPVRDVLDGINHGIVDHLTAETHAAGDAFLPYEEVIDRLSLPVTKENLPVSLDSGKILQIDGLSPGQLRALLTRSGAASPWKSALFGSRFVVQGRDLVENPVQRLLDGMSGHAAEIQPDAIALFTETGQTLLKISKREKRISIVLFTHVTRDNQPASLALEFDYRPETPYAPIWEVMGDRNERIGTMYRELWQDQKPHASFEGSFVIDSARVREFNRATGYSKAHQQQAVPMDFAIVICWTPICSALLQNPIQGDVLNLVHLANAYEAGPVREQGRRGVPRLMVGDKLKTRAYVKSVTIESSGKVVQVACEIWRAEPGGPLIMTVCSSFLFRGNYTDFSATFAHETEPRFELDISSETDIAILDSKPWFRLDQGSQLDHLNLTDLTLEFHLETSTKWRSKSTFASVDTRGRVYIRSETGDLTPVGTVDYHGTECRNNAVLSYLRRWGRPVRAQQTHPLQRPGGLEYKSEIRIPSSNEAYSRASGDFNPIHTSPLFAKLANLPGTVTHGMYCSAAVRQVVEKYAASRDPDRIRNYKVSFVGMVLPDDVLEVSLCHSGMQAGLRTIDITVSNKQTGAKVLTGSALVAQPTTTVVFTGQGSQEKGMGMHLYASSPVARSIWDRAEAYFASQFGVSILEIVRNNPKEIKVHFGGVRGRMLRQNYLSMCHYEAGGTEATQGTSRLIRRPIFPTVTETSTSYTHSSPNGLLFSTQFAQPALTIMELAAFKDMETRGLVDPDCRFAGHSLGEYAALLSTTASMSLEDLLYTVFCRGMTMQDAVERDERGRSGFAMVAVDPSRVSKEFSESALRELVDRIQARTGFFLEIVNLNIRDRQYVCAGDRRALGLLQRVCDDLHKSARMSAHRAADHDPSLLQQDLIEQGRALFLGRPPQEVPLERGVATVPLAGVDVPFHSSLLRPRMEAFRRVLQESLNLDRVKPERLSVFPVGL